MRSAPIGLVPEFASDLFDWHFRTASKAAPYTHGHPTAQVASGALAVLIAAIVQGQSLNEAVSSMMQKLEQVDDNKETLEKVQQATELAALGDPGAQTLEQLGEGWVAEEALAIAVYAALLRCPRC